MRTLTIAALVLLASGALAPGAVLDLGPLLDPLAPPELPLEPDALDAMQPLGFVPEAPLGEGDGAPGAPRMPPLDHPAVAVAAGGAAAALAFLGLALYSRLSRHDLLENEHRQRVLDLVKEKPGIALTEIAERAGLGWGTTVYHLDRLERAGMLASERSGARRCFFPVGALPREDRKGLGALQEGTARSVATFVLERPGATQGELASALGLSASAASKQVSKLESHGLLRREREWKTVRLHPEPTLTRLLAA